MLFDSHAHYNDSRFDGDRDEILSLMRENNVGYIMNSCSNTGELPDIAALCEKYDFIYSSAGVHPHDAKDMTERDIDILKEYLKNPKFKAVGEIGLDYYYDFTPREIQKKQFARQIELARGLDLPIVIHDRDAHKDCMDIVRAYKDGIKGEFHCYSGSVETAREILGWGMYIALGGALTFKNSKRAREVALYAPLDMLLIETDCPYLTPEPHRGKRNSSLYIHYVAEMIAAVKGITVKEVEDATAENAKRMFNIS